MAERGTPAREVTARNALRDGSITVKLSAAVWGLGCLVRKQFVKGALCLLAEIAVILYMVRSGFYNLGKLVTLGDVEQQKIWNEAKSLYEYVDGDRSLVILLYGIITLAVLLCAVLLVRVSLRCAYAAELECRSKGRAAAFREEARELLDSNLHRTLLFLPIVGILMFTVLPLLFMTSMAFTNYSIINDKLVLFDWVGFDNFKRMLNLGGDLGRTFWPVLGWTFCWAVIATFTNYFIGLILTLFINWKEIRAKKFWRFCFVLTVAVPHFVTLLIIRQMLQPTGAVNVLLQNMGLISAPLPFFTDTMWARCSVVLINIWVGVPYVLLQMTGILQNIPPELYEAARVDGANPVVMFFKITLPYVLFVTTPYLITTFTGNINNFNVIFLTCQGLPRAVESTAGSTDLLITWLYKLTIDNRYYDVGAVIGILTFVSLSAVSLLTFRFSGSYKDEEGFR